MHNYVIDEIYRDSTSAVIVIASINIDITRSRHGHRVYAALKPDWIIICTGTDTKGFDILAEPASIDELCATVPGLREKLQQI